ncbi:tyrosyl-tRNA synthetase [Gaeumannomyces tritici R3-111a-1]|uniref:Tyrosine--tRNA ligase n=1 Tax=Gaeumannomyces tritici (strain R3-111a-1) TaxID=644352 RepID=J3NGI5_GAET3|nr:tyrosyl-tRNA synthetase [Gaeumannomyces tritici R3-111a-1]EJT80375.1 tyrosyl-tRNA synthetase [Gaeumannomyces tritici R3-111a-1]
MLRNVNRRLSSMAQASLHRRNLSRLPPPGCFRCSSPQTASFSGSAWRCESRSIKYKEKMRLAQVEWDLRAEKIKDGTETGLWDLLESRGFIKDVAGNRDHIRELMRVKRIGGYVGIDPTAPSLHVGHLVPLMPIFWMYMHGYRAVTLLGGATAKIGDPTGRLKDRNPNGSDFAKNMASLHYQLKRMWVNVEAQARQYGFEPDWAWRRDLVNNNRWWNKQPMLEVLQRLGRHVRVGPMLSRDMVKRKMTEGDGLSFAELSYTLMQGWDFFELNKQMGIQLQIGGSDQFGNIVVGIDAVKTLRASENLSVHDDRFGEGPMVNPVGFTVPLLTNSDGEKIGKSSGGGNMWLDVFQTPAYDLYGYFVRQPDADVERLLKLLTFIPNKEISLLMREHEADPRERVAQHKLAFEVLTLVHGVEVARRAKNDHATLHGKDSTPIQFTHDPEVHATPTNMAGSIQMQLPKSLVEQGNVARILFAAGLASSVSDGNRLAIQKAVYIGGRPGKARGPMNSGQLDFKPVSLWFPQETQQFIVEEKLLILRKGKHRVRIIELLTDEEYAASGQTYPGQPGTGRLRAVRNDMRALTEAQNSLAAEIDEGKAKDALSGFSTEMLSLADRVSDLRKQLDWSKEHYNSAKHNPTSSPKAVGLKIHRLEKQYEKLKESEELLKRKTWEGWPEEDTSSDSATNKHS